MPFDSSFTLLYAIIVTMAVGLLGILFAVLIYGFVFMKPSKDH